MDGEDEEFLTMSSFFLCQNFPSFDICQISSCLIAVLWCLRSIVETVCVCVWHNIVFKQVNTRCSRTKSEVLSIELFSADICVISRLFRILELKRSPNELVSSLLNCFDSRTSVPCSVKRKGKQETNCSHELYCRRNFLVHCLSQHFIFSSLFFHCDSKVIAIN